MYSRYISIYIIIQDEFQEEAIILIYNQLQSYQRLEKFTVPANASLILCIRSLSTRRARKAKLLKKEDVTIEEVWIWRTDETNLQEESQDDQEITLRLECNKCKRRRVIVVGRAKTVVLMDIKEIKKKNTGKGDQFSK